MPPREPNDLVDDIVEHADLALQLTTGLTLEYYLADQLRRLAVERALENVGEALRQMHHSDPSVVARIDDASGMIGFRNVLAHRFFDIDHARVLAIIRTRLPNLRGQARAARPPQP